MSRLAQLILVPALLLASPAFAAKTWLTPPSLSWDELRPYVHANIVPLVTDEGLDVRLCTGTTERSVASPFDEDVSRFVKLMLLQLAYRDERFAEDLARFTQGFRERLPTEPAGERERVRSQYWDELDRNAALQDRLRATYERARTKGRLRCWLCDESPQVLADIAAAVPR